MQFLFPNHILTGTGATAVLLILYFYLQNKSSVVDELTGYYNRKAFFQMLKITLKKNKKVSVLLVSIDDFKTINDKFGQTKGDCFLKGVGDYLSNILPSKTIYRYSGDEFAVILPQTAEFKFDVILEKISKRFQENWNCDNVGCRLSASLSGIESPQIGSDLEEIIIILESCIEKSKKTGKGKIVLPDADLLKSIRRKTQIEDILKKNVNSAGFYVEYQPIYSLSKKSFSSLEALIRLETPELGKISPFEFIEMAEENGHITEIGNFVINQVCKDILVLEKEGIDHITVSINISVIQMLQENIVETVLEIIRKNKVSPEKIKLEITESVFLDQYAKIKEIMNQLKSYGIQFYVDDFGTGYSNIVSVVELPFTYVKFDKSMIYNAMKNEKSKTILGGLVTTFSKAGFKVLVEGIEKEDELELVTEMSVEYIQGFYYSRPIPINQIIKLLKSGE